MNKNIALITDLHFGIKNDNQVWLIEQVKFYKKFINDLISRDIKQLIILGDVFDRRKYTNHATIQALNACLFKPLKNAGVETHIIVGNHDCYYRNTNKLSSPKIFLSNYGNVKVYTDPIDIKIFDTSILMLPWINEENNDEALALIKNTKSKICMGHLEVTGFEMYKGVGVCHGGMSQKLFKNFDIVFSGHFHQPSKQGNIQYLGAPMQYTWSDYDCERGYYIFNTDDLSLEFIENDSPMFIKLFWEDGITDYDINSLKNKTVRLIISKNSDEEKLNEFIEKLNTAGLYDLAIVDNTRFEYDAEIELDTNTDNEDAGELVKEYVSNLSEENETNIDTDTLVKLFNDIYIKAQAEL